MKAPITAKALYFFSFFILLISFARADEGMWMPLQLKQKEADLKAKGLQIPVEDIFSNDGTSLKDAVVQFGTGCTGEVVSAEGLILTNHHCGFSQIQSLSTMEHDYIKNGYWSKNKGEELPCPGLTITFIVKIENVTSKILPELKSTMTADERDTAIAKLSIKIEKEATKGTKYTAKVRSFYYGNEFYLFVTQVFKDIRFVGAPPVSIGKFGGETDNWIWPRHTGDFSMFRVYADSSNNVADYSPKNVPFKPRKFLSISIKGVKENDFTMVYGFPGRTQEYLPSYGVELVQKINDPSKVRVRDAKLKIWQEARLANDTIRLQYASKYATIANYYKKWKGEVRGLERADAINRKRTFETQFMKWVNENKKDEYKNLLSDMEATYNQITPLSRLNDYYNEAIIGTELINYLNLSIKPLAELAKKDSVSDDSLKVSSKKIRNAITGTFKNYRPALDQKVFATLLKLYHDSVPESFHPDIYNTINSKFKGNYDKYAEFVFEKTIFADSVKLRAFLADFNKKSLKKILNDPAYQVFLSFSEMMKAKVTQPFNNLTKKIADLQRDYMRAQMEMRKNEVMYPDANSTLRFAYGLIRPYDPRDGVHYNYQTTLEGLMDKYDPNNSEFQVPSKLRELYKTKDFGRYGEGEKMPVCFLANTHTTGGNSGSPMINARGELIGLNFDSVWEGTMCDINYDINYNRNIIVDIRYVLFVIEKFGGAKNLTDEMHIN